MKIVYSTESVTRNGGIQTVTIVKANALADIEGNDVYIVVPHIHGSSPRIISPKVHLINLGISRIQKASQRLLRANRARHRCINRTPRQKFLTSHQDLFQSCVYS